MERSDSSSVAFSRAQLSLAPYIKSRQEVSRIRQLLASQLDRHFDYKAGHSRLIPLSLVDESVKVKSPSETFSGLRKQYIKAYQANIKARQEYDRTVSAATAGNGGSTTQRAFGVGVSYSATTSPENKNLLERYVTLVNRRQQYERLRILQDYVDKLEQKFTAATSYLDKTTGNTSLLSRIPSEIIATSEISSQNSTREDLQNLILDLEKAVLRAKFQVKSERLRFEQVRRTQTRHQQAGDHPPLSNADRLEALSQTRNELIRWIEEELGNAGGSMPPVVEDEKHKLLPENRDTIKQRLDSIQNGYHRYAEVRKLFLETAGDHYSPAPSPIPTDNKEDDSEDIKKENSSTENWVVMHFLKDLLSISNEQKSLIQQKSHIIVSLAKQHKETNLALDRLADESHLLPEYSLTARKVSYRDLGQLDSDELLSKETPNTGHRARTWTQAADVAGQVTKDEVLTKTGEGQATIQSARDLLFTLDELLGHRSLSQTEQGCKGYGDQAEDIWMPEAASKNPRFKKLGQNPASESNSSDIWASLNGNLGVL